MLSGIIYNFVLLGFVITNDTLAGVLPIITISMIIVLILNLV